MDHRMKLPCNGGGGPKGLPPSPQALRGPGKRRMDGSRWAGARTVDGGANGSKMRRADPGPGVRSKDSHPIFLAARYGVQVVSVDLWIPADERNERARAGSGVDSRIVALQGDIGRGLPPEFGSFEGIFLPAGIPLFWHESGDASLPRFLAETGRQAVFRAGLFPARTRRDYRHCSRTPGGGRRTTTELPFGRLVA